MTVVVDMPIRPQPDWAGKLQLHEVSPDTTVQSGNNQPFLDSVLGDSARYLHVSRSELHVVNAPYKAYDGATKNDAAFKTDTASLAVQAMHQAYAQHVPYSMRPDTFWYMIVHEVAEHIRQNPDKYAALFTTAPDIKQTIVIHDNGRRWEKLADVMRLALQAQAGLRDGTMELFLPRFSTSTIEDETALLATFLDVVSPYYGTEYRILCGIPQVRLEGEPSDWWTLYSHTKLLAGKFTGLANYFASLMPVLQKIVETASGTAPDEEFWRSIYQYEGGCGDPTIRGWITAFFAHKRYTTGVYLRENFNRNDWRSGFNVDDFPSHVSNVPFVLNDNGAKCSAAFLAGITGVDYDGIFLTPRLGFAVAEKN